VVGSFEGNDKQELKRESDEQDELNELVKRVADIPFGDILFRCSKCGQLWTGHLTSKGGPAEWTLYTKITIDDARKRFPEFKA
jgi:hypothetical protein